ncbi:hypothetical protein JCM15519_31230 [Fundidesulfovibrio butyratiphilus]
MYVKNAMSTRILFVDQDATVAQAMRIMAENNLRRLMVDRQDENSPYATVTIRDFIAKVITKGVDPGEIKVRDIMTEALYSVTPDSTLEDAAQLMQGKNVAGLPVIDQSGKLVGVIAMWDILIALGVHCLSR